MYLLISTVLHYLRSRRRSRLDLWRDVSTVRMRAGLLDVDIARHINNGRYFSLMDHGRGDLYIRSGAWPAFSRRRWFPVVAAETGAFRVPVSFGQAFDLRTRIVGADERGLYLEHRVVVDGQIAMRAFVVQRVLGPQGGVAMTEVYEAIGAPPADLVTPEWVLTWREANALPSPRADATDDWA